MGRTYTGEKASSDADSLLGKLLMYVRLCKNQGRTPTTRGFRDQNGLSKTGGEKTIALARKKGYVVFKGRKGSAHILDLGPNANEVATYIGFVKQD